MAGARLTVWVARRAHETSQDIVRVACSSREAKQGRRVSRQTRPAPQQKEDDMLPTQTELATVLQAALTAPNESGEPINVTAALLVVAQELQRVADAIEDNSAAQRGERITYRR